MRSDAIRIHSHDPGWSESFEAQAAVLTGVLGRRLARPVEHIGSTAVPGLPAKAIVDVLAVVHALATFDAVVGDLAPTGWRLAPEPGDRERRKRSLCFPTIEHRSHHLHVVESDHPDWRGWLLFRDYLRAHPHDATRYAELKRQLAAEDDTDRARYRAGKEPLIAELMGRARSWSGGLSG